jgi:hypothetical protein
MGARYEPKRRLPDFIVVGPPRTATSGLSGSTAGFQQGMKETLFLARNCNGHGLARRALSPL